MNKYISILRGINVSGQKKIKMTDLKALYESLGFINVITYIQSGNVIFEYTSNDIAAIKMAIEAGISVKYGFDVPVDVRTDVEFRKILAQMPFQNIDVETDGTKVLFTFLAGKPSEDNIATLKQYVKEPEKLINIERVVYLHCPNGYGKTKLSNVFIEKKLAVSATTRNLKSLIKLCDLASK